MSENKHECWAWRPPEPIQAVLCEECAKGSTPRKPKNNRMLKALSKSLYARPRIVQQKGGNEMRPVYLQDIEITSGRIAAGDAICYPNNVFEQAVEPREYPVYCWRQWQEIIAAHIGNATLVARWEPTLLQAEDGTTANNYATDAGVGCFVDASVASQLDHSERLKHFLVVEYPGESTWIYPVDEEHHAAIFNSGAGDGEYPVYVGYDRAGKPICFLVDFLMVEDEEKFWV